MTPVPYRRVRVDYSNINQNIDNKWHYSSQTRQPSRLLNLASR